MRKTQCNYWFYLIVFIIVAVLIIVFTMPQIDTMRVNRPNRLGAAIMAKGNLRGLGANYLRYRNEFFTPTPIPSPQTSSPQTSSPMVCTTHRDCHNTPDRPLCQRGKCIPNPCDSVKSCEATGKKCGWCFDNYDKSYHGVAMPGNEYTSSLVGCDNYVYSPKNCTNAKHCAEIKNCSDITSKSWCGWCTDSEVALLTDIHGRASDTTPTGHKCGAFVNIWGRQPNNCQRSKCHTKPSPHHISPHHRSPHHRSPHHISPHHRSPHHRSPHHRSPHHRSPDSGFVPGLPYDPTPHDRSPHHRSPHHRSPDLPYGPSPPEPTPYRPSPPEPEPEPTPYRPSPPEPMPEPTPIPYRPSPIVPEPTPVPIPIPYRPSPMVPETDPIRRYVCYAER